MSAYQDYQKLTLTVLEKISIAPSTWQAIGVGRAEPLEDTYRSILPVIVARFNEAAAEILMAKARSEDSITLERKHRIIVAYNQDIAAIDHAFFGSAQSVASSKSGLFRTVIAPQLHGDSGQGEQERFYIGRLGSLPVNFVRRSDLNSLSKAEGDRASELISVSRQGAEIETVRNAHDELRSAGIMHTLPLRDIALMVLTPTLLGPLSKEGTLHCSSELPVVDGKMEPQHSVLLRNYFMTLDFSP